MNKAILKTMCVASALAVSVPALAGKPAGACKRVKWVEGQYFEVNASVHAYTHIILPEPIQGKPMHGSPELWDVQGENVHLFIKPYNYGNKEGGRTSVTVISDTNNSYDFVVKRSAPGAATPCVIMTSDQQVAAKGSSNGWLRPEDQKVNSLKEQVNYYEQQLAKASVDSDAKAMDALDKYRANVFTGYTWTGAKNGFISTDIVADVFDDGRFTIIRLHEDKKGVMQLKASINGSEEFVEYDYNSDQKIYTVAGLYPQLVLSYDDTEIVITRKEG